MEIDKQGYLELSAQPQLAGLFLSSDAAILFDPHLERPLWVNAAGAELLGEASIAAALAARFDLAHPLIRQFRDAAAQLVGEDPIVRGFRVARGSRTEFIQCVIVNPEIAGNGVLVTCNDERLFKQLREHEAAQRALGAMEEISAAACVLDAYGLPIAFTLRFAEADFNADDIEAMSRDAISQDTAVRRDLSDLDGNTWRAIVASLGKDPDRLLLVASEAEARAEEKAAAPAIVSDRSGDPSTAHSVQLDLLPDETIPDRTVEGVTGDDGAEPVAEPALEADDSWQPAGSQSRLDEWYLGSSAVSEKATQRDEELRTPSREADTPQTAQPAEPLAAEEHGTAAAIDEDFAEDDWARSAIEGPGGGPASNDEMENGDWGRPELIEAIAEEDNEAELEVEIGEPSIGAEAALDAAVDESVAKGKEFSFTSSSEPVRFAWTVDDHQIFLSVSPELAQTVGPNAADIVGRRWKDVAKVFGFDTSGDIQRLLEKRDTWSGKSVLWPVQGTDLVVPVDLAALPAFSGARQFDGFRGFGIIRTADVIFDPDETGLALVSGPAKPKPESKPAPHGIDAGLDASRRLQSVDRDDRDAPDGNGRAQAGAAGGNVVDLTSRKRDRGDELSKTEARAFQEIGRKLVEDAPVKPAEPASDFLVETMPSRTVADEHPKKSPTGDVPRSTANGEVRKPGSAVNGDDAGNTAILKKLPVPVLVYRMGESLYANPELLSITGYASLEELSEAGGVDALFSPADGDGTLSEGDNGALPLRRRDGSSVQVSPLLQSVPWLGGRALLLSFRPPIQPNGGEKAAVDMARVAELQNILDTATDGILVTTREGQIESLNAPAEALFGVNHRDAAGLPLTELFAKESHRAVEEYMRELKEPGVAGLINNGREVIGRHAKGGLIPLFLTLGRMGQEEKFCAVLRDITPWKRAEEELVGARRVAESASEQKSEFLARVSHEIRTPLNAIIGFSDVMIEERFGPIDNDRYRGYLRDINRSGVHVLDLINDLLDISKIEAGKMELTYEAVDLNQLVSETVALLQPQANAERIIIRTSLSRAVPRVVADARSIRQIILNLVSNAIKFTPANGQVIVSTVYEGNGEVVMRVRDTGRGMSEREIEHAMKPFHQVNVTDERRGQGTGLGLPLTKALVEANRAYFDLESTPGEGTIAHVHFPTQRVLAD